MKLFLDSAKIDEIRHALAMWDADGITTNPRHVKSAGKPRRAVYEEIAELTAGTDKPVSVEVDPTLGDWRKIVDEGLALSRLAPNFVVKVGASEAGFKALRELARQGVKTNATLIFTVSQAWHAARCGATYISPFLGWKESHGDDSTALVGEVATMLRRWEYPSQIIAAALRTSRQIGAAALAGAHCATAGFEVWQESFRNPYTDYGERLFGQAWRDTPET